MIDHELVLLKAGAVRKYVNRVKEKGKIDFETFFADIDRQEIVIFNIQMALQNVIDIAAHIISEKGLGMPGSTNEMFYLLEENGFLDFPLTERMVKAVGLRNLIVHEYGKLDLKRIFNVAQHDIDDLLSYLEAILFKVGIS